MTFEEAKNKQIEEFSKGRYLVLKENFPGEFCLVPATSRQVAKESLTKDVPTPILRMPARLRALPGGKSKT